MWALALVDCKEKGVGSQFFKIKTKIQPGARFKSHFPSFKYLKLSFLFGAQDVGRSLISLTLRLPRPAVFPLRNSKKEAQCYL